MSDTQLRTDAYDLDDLADTQIAAFASYARGLQSTEGLSGAALEAARDANAAAIRAAFEMEPDGVFPDGVSRDALAARVEERFRQRYRVVQQLEDQSGVGLLLLFDEAEARYVFVADGTELNPARVSANERRLDAFADFYIAYGDQLHLGETTAARILVAADKAPEEWNELLALPNAEAAAIAKAAYDAQVEAFKSFLLDNVAQLGLTSDQIAVVGDSLGGSVMVEALIRIANETGETFAVDAATAVNAPGRASQDGGAGGQPFLNALVPPSQNNNISGIDVFTANEIRSMVGLSKSLPNITYTAADGDEIGNSGVPIGVRLTVAPNDASQNFRAFGVSINPNHSLAYQLAQGETVRANATAALQAAGISDADPQIVGISGENAIFGVMVTIGGKEFVLAIDGQPAEVLDPTSQMFPRMIPNPELTQRTSAGGVDGNGITLLSVEEAQTLVSALQGKSPAEVDAYLAANPRYAAAAASGDIALTERHSFCFGAGTQILMADGRRRSIEDICVGDEVLAFDPDEGEGCGELYPRKVTQTFRTENADVVRLNEKTLITPGHRVLSAGGDFRSVEDLSVGDFLIDEFGQEKAFQKISKAERQTVYNFTVEGFHTYVADGLRVHNESPFAGDHFGDDEIRTMIELNDGSRLLIGDSINNRDVVIRMFELAGDNGETTQFAQRYWLYEEDGIDLNVVVSGEWEEVVNPDGSIDGQFVDIDNNKLEIQFNQERYVGQDIGAIFGSSLGRQLAGENVFAQIGLGSLLGAVTGSIGGFIERSLDATDPQIIQPRQSITDYNAKAIGEAAEDTIENFDNLLWQQFKSASVGAVSSYLTTELIDVLGVSGFGGELASTVGNRTINTIISNLTDSASAGTTAFSGLLPSTTTEIVNGVEVVKFNPGALTNAVGSFLGAKLANQVISADTTAGQLGGSVGGAIGSLVAGKLIGSSGSLFGVKLGVFAGPVGALIGAFLGTVFGTLIGDLFGKTPRSGADLEYDPETGEFVIGHSWKRGKGSKETAEAMAGQVGETLNGVLALIGGTLLNPEEVTPGHYGMYKSRLRWASEYGEPAVYFKEAGDVVAFGAMVALEDMKILGGDIYMKRALNQSLENQKQGPEISIGGEMTAFRPADYDSDALNDPELEILLGDLTVAQDYAAYLENAAIINGLIAAQPDSAFAAGWIITLQRAYELGLHRRHEADWYGGWAFFLEDNGALTGTVDLSLDPASGERLITFTDENGVRRTRGDTVDSAGKDNIQGTAGADMIVVSGATLYHSASSAGLTVNGEALTTDNHEIDGVAAIHGGAGNDTIWGGDRGNDVFGGAGDDRLYGGATADWLFGGDGNDTLDANISDDGNLLSGGAGNDSLIGRGGSDWLDGGAGNDTLDGGGGSDVLEGGAGDDVVRGGRGDDIYRFDAGDGADAISDEGFAQAAPERPVTSVQIEMRFGPQHFSRIEALTLGYLGFNWDPRSTSYLQGGVSSAAVTARGKAQGGEDVLVLGEGIGLSDIRLRRDADGAGVADDLLVEVLDAQGALTGDAVRLQDWFDPFNRIEWLEFADGQRLRIGDFSSFTIGTAGDDIIFGTDGNDFVHGGAGNDIMHLLRGDDIGNGGLGDDFITGDGGSDIVIGGNDNDIVLGGSGDDVVSGDLGDDLVRGDTGNDVLTGGFGADTVVGGAGDDVFKFSRGDGRDTIIDAYSADGWETVFNGAAGWVAGVTFVDVDHDNDPTTGLVSQVHYNGEVIFDGERWSGAYSFDTTTNILLRHAGDAYGDLGGDTIEFGIGIEIGDLVFQTVDGELVIGVNSAVSDNKSFDGLNDRITLQGWNAGVRGIESFSFFNAGIVDLDRFTQLKGGTDGNDAIAGSIGDDWLTGGAGDDALDGAGGDDLLVGHGGGDALEGGDGNDTLLGGSGDDILDGGAGADALIGGEGFDIASYASATQGVSVALKNSAVVDANPTADVFSGIEGLEGSAYNDTLIGDAGDNEIIGGAGADRLEGGAGDDLYTIRAGDGDDVILDRGVDASGVSEETAVSAEGAVGSGFAESFSLVSATPLGGGAYQYTYQWTLTHSASGDTAYSQQLSYFSPQGSAPQFFNANYWLNGFAPTGRGREVSRSVGAVSYFDGGADDALLWETGESLSQLAFTIAGNDLLIQGGANTLRIEDFQLAESRIEELSLSDGLAVNLGGIVFNGAGAENEDFLVGDGAANALNGGAGDDVLSGGGGADTLSGDDGDDVLEGGAGADSLDGGEGLDTARYLGSSAGVTVNLATGAGLGGEAEGDALSNIEIVHGSQYADNLIGDAADNRLFGHEGADVMDGGAGNVVLDGGEGMDSLSGGAGDDNLDGGAGADVLYGGDGVDALLGGDGNDQLFGDGGVDHLAGEDGDDTLDGGADSDVLTGGAGNDMLKGGAGDDILIGGAGNDTLEGGLGDDVYEFDASSGNDVIVDSDGANHIVFAGAAREDLRFDRSGDNLVIRAMGTAGSLTLSNYYAAGGTVAHTIAAGDHILYLEQASAFFDLFSALPVDAGEHSAAISAELDRYWHLFGNARPEGAAIALTTDEDNAVSGAVAATDHDQNVTGYSMGGAPLYGSVVLDAATGAFTYTPNADYYGDDVFFVNIEDSEGNVVDVMVSVAIAPVNDAPSEVLFSGVADIAENVSDIDLGALGVIDVDGAPNEHTLSVDDARFEIVDNVLRLRSGVALDFETETSVTVAVTATDGAGASNVPSVLTFNIVDVNEGPSLGAASFAVNEDAGAGAVVGSLAASDPDGGAFGDLRYYFRSAAGEAISVSEDGLFAVDALTGIVTLLGASLDYETAPDYALTGLVRDNGGADGYLEATAAIDIAVANINEAPTGVSLSNASVDENVDGAIIGALSATDADGPAGGAFSQHAFTVDDARFFVDGAGNLRLKAGEQLNFEAAPTLSVNVTATDQNGAGLSFTQNFTLTVNDLIDVLNGTAGADVLAGEQGVDHIFGFGGDDILTGGAGDDLVDGGAGADRLEGGAGADNLSGSAGSDTLLGEEGDDALSGGDGEDSLDGGAGVDVIDGGANNDSLYGGDGADTLLGGEGNDLLVGGAGADMLDGGAGEDTASYQDALTGVTIDLVNGANNTGDAAGDVFTAIEVFRGSDHADAFTGDAAGNVFHGFGGNDTIIGNDGNDVLYGGAGDDFIDADDGMDMLDGGEGADILVGGADQDLYMIDRASGADVIRNYDPMNADDTISYADDIAYTDLWFERIGDDLAVSVIGTGTVTTIEDWYVGAGAGDMYDISLFLVDNRETLSVNAEQLVTIMSQYLVDAGATKPQTQAEMQAALSVIGGAVDAQWGFSTPPTIEAINDATVNEDGSLTFTARIYDDKVAAELLTVGVVSSDAAIVSAADVAIGAADADGYRQVTVTPKEDASGVVTVTLRATDGGSGVAEEAFTLTVSAIADTPTLAVFSAAGNAGAPIALNIVASQTDSDLSETLTIEIAGVPATAVLSAGVDQGGGVWRLNASELAGLTLTPAAGDATDVDLTVTAISAEGGTSEQVSALLSVSVNGAPSDIVFSGAVDENAANGTVVGTASHTDPDAGGAHIYSLVNDAGGRFTIDGATGEVSVLNGALLDHEAAGAHAIRIRIVDQGGLAREEDFSISIADVNEAFSFAAQTLSIAENAAIGDSVGYHTGADPDSGVFGEMRYYFADGAGVAATSSDGRFTINELTGLVTVNGALDHEQAGAHEYAVIARDNAGAPGYFEVSRTLTINVTDVNEAPTDIIPTGALTASEAGGNGTVVADFNHADPEGGTMSYALTDNAGGRFAINATTGVLTIANAGAIDYEAATSHGVSVRVTDPGGLSRTETFTINVANVNEAPTDIWADRTLSWNENVGAGAGLAWFRASDPDNGETFTYSLLNDAGGRYGLRSDGWFHKGGTPTNFESASSHNILVRVTDSGGAVRDEWFTVGVRDVNERPTIQGATFNRAENWNPTVSIGTVSFNDPDLPTTANGQVSMSIIGGNTGNKFRIDNSGRLWLNSALDYENASQRNFTLTVRARDNNGSGLHRDATVRVNVTNINEAPIVTNYSIDFRIVGGQGQLYSTIEAYDPEGRNLSYSVINAVYAENGAPAPHGLLSTFPGGVFVTPPRSAAGQATVTVRISDGARYTDQSAWYHVFYSDFYPVVIDLDGDGVEMLSLAESAVSFDMNGDGVLDQTGWVSPDDGLLALDRNGDGVINDGSEISFINDLPGAESDLEGLAAFDSNANGLIDSGDERWSEFRLWRDVNADGVSQADELMSLTQAGVGAISLTRTLVDEANQKPEWAGNPVSAISEVLFTDGTVRESADVAFNYIPGAAASQSAVPVVLDLDGDGMDIRGVSQSSVYFDADGDGVRNRISWVGPADGLLALDRNNDGVIGDISEISFVEDLPGAVTDLEGLRAFDTNGDNVLGAGDERFEEFLVWRDENQNGVSEAGELRSLSEAGVLWIDLNITKTGAEAGAASDFVVTGVSNFVTTAGDIRTVGDVAFRYLDADISGADGHTGDMVDSASPASETPPRLELPPVLETYPVDREPDHHAYAASRAIGDIEALFSGMLRDMIYSDRENSFSDYSAPHRAARTPEITAASDLQGDVNAGYATFLEAMARFDAVDNGSLTAYRGSYREDQSFVLAAGY